jgi:hypothetical protein
MSLMTTVKYSPKDYSGTSTHFVTKYVEAVADYDSRVSDDQQLSQRTRTTSVLG